MSALVKVAVFKRRRHWRLECTAPACKHALRNLRFANHAMAVQFAAGHIGDHNALRDALTRAHAVSRMGSGR